MEILRRRGGRLKSQKREEMKKYVILIIAMIVQVFAIGTIIWWATDVFALYSTNQFTGRMRSFDVDYWNAVGGAAVVTFGIGIANYVNKRFVQKALDSWEEEIEERTGLTDDELVRRVFEQLK
jgi:hypothetical protein